MAETATEPKPKMALKQSENFDTNEGYVQYLIEEYAKFKKALFNLGLQEIAILKAMDQLVDPEVKAGKATLEGQTHNIKVERRLNASYPKERNEVHPLRELMDTFDDLLGKLINVEYKESGTKIQALVDRVTKGDPHTPEEAMLVEKLQEKRVVKPGKIGIEIVERKK